METKVWRKEIRTGEGKIKITFFCHLRHQCFKNTELIFHTGISSFLKAIFNELLGIAIWHKKIVQFHFVFSAVTLGRAEECKFLVPYGFAKQFFKEWSLTRTGWYSYYDALY